MALICKFSKSVIKRLTIFYNRFQQATKRQKLMLQFFYFIIWFIEKIGYIFLRMIASLATSKENIIKK